MSVRYFSCVCHTFIILWLVKFLSICLNFSVTSVWLVEIVLEKAYAAGTCMRYSWYKLINMLSASDWSKLYWQKLMQQECVWGIPGIG